MKEKKKVPKAPKWMQFYWKKYKLVRGSRTKSKTKATREADKIRKNRTTAKAYHYEEKWYAVYKKDF